MTYSCTDFTDSILDALGIVLPEELLDSPSDQADLALAEIERLQACAAAAPHVPELISMAESLIHRARCMNAVQHAGNPVTPDMWSELYDATNSTAAVLAKMRGAKAEERGADNLAALEKRALDLGFETLSEAIDALESSMDGR